MKDSNKEMEMRKLLNDVCLVLEYQSKPALSNQGQCLDGYSALANYNSIAEKIKRFLEKERG